MSSAHRRRLVQDQSSLRTSPPPDYFFPPTSSADDLSSLSICLAGPSSTPFESGVFHLTLRIPQSYPQEPPKANFATKIFHPNVDNRTGDVCVDTLKRDWSSKLTLRDVLITIRCLLVYSNPTSSLNEEAGRLQLEDYDGFARHARLMAEVHASVPDDLEELVEETRRRTAAQDEDNNGPSQRQGKAAQSFSKDNKQTTTVVRKIKRATSPTIKSHRPSKPITPPDSDSESDGDSGKENAPAPARRPATPPKRSFQEAVSSSQSASASTESEPAETEESGRKSPKLKEGQQANARKPVPSKPTTTTSATKKKVVSSAGKDAPKKKQAAKVGLKRF